ncbi:MAG: DUF2283 domain-containing protein [Candidatus Humimicrobiaceae bacterium]
MNIKYSKDEDILLLEISDERIDYAEEEGPLIIHYSAGHKPVLIEILEASMVLSSVIETKAKRKNNMLF